ncbi:MAG: transporter substrate-binding domain-containing protein [Beijerinckiaceae bacterium]|jgi:polar amino acid transport system substrate-binding protein
MAPLAVIPLVAALFLAATPAVAGETAAKPFIPNLFDPAGQDVKPEALPVKSIRFLTTDDFPPFHFALPDGTLAGFDIDLARAICAGLKITCTIQARRFETLTSALAAGQGDAVIAALANTAANRAALDFTAPYYTTPARFVTPLKSPVSDVTPEALSGHTIGVQAGTAHLAFLQAFYPASIVTAYPDQETLRAALRDGKAEAIFGDGIALSLWLNGTGSAGCCAFQGGPFTESRFFGNGVSIAVAKNNTKLRATLDYELEKLSQDGIYADLYLKYFPTGFY